MELGIGKIYKLFDAREGNACRLMNTIGRERLKNDPVPFWRQVLDGPPGSPWFGNNRSLSERIQNPAECQHRVGAIRWHVSPFALRLLADLLAQIAHLAFQRLKQNLRSDGGNEDFRSLAEEHDTAFEHIHPD